MKKFSGKVFLVLGWLLPLAGTAQQQNTTPLIISIDPNNKAQTIDNFWAAGC